MTTTIANPEVETACRIDKIITGYLILSLSVDNIFVIAIIFRPSPQNTSISFILGYSQQRIQRFDDLLALCLSINFSGQPTSLVSSVFTAMKMLFTTGDQKFEPKKSFVFCLKR
jgi:tellurite resistance protein TerC